MSPARAVTSPSQLSYICYICVIDRPNLETVLYFRLMSARIFHDYVDLTCVNVYHRFFYGSNQWIRTSCIISTVTGFPTGDACFHNEYIYDFLRRFWTIHESIRFYRNRVQLSAESYFCISQRYVMHGLFIIPAVNLCVYKYPRDKLHW